MNILNKLGLTKRISFQLELEKEEVKRQLLSYTKVKIGLFAKLSSSSFNPGELSLEGDNFKISKSPRFLNPFGAVGEIVGKLIESNGKTLIEARVHSWYFWLVAMIFFSLLLYSPVLLILRHSSTSIKVLWFFLFQTLNVVYFFILKFQAKQLSKKFKIFVETYINVIRTNPVANIL